MGSSLGKRHEKELAKKTTNSVILGSWLLGCKKVRGKILKEKEGGAFPGILRVLEVLPGGNLETLGFLIVLPEGPSQSPARWLRPRRSSL